MLPSTYIIHSSSPSVSSPELLVSPMDDYSSDNQSDDGVVPGVVSVGEVVELPELWFPTKNGVGSLKPWDVMLLLAHCHQMVMVKNFGRLELFEANVEFAQHYFSLDSDVVFLQCVS